MNDNLKVVLAVDPGRAKSGLAVLDYSTKVLYKNIINSSELESYLIEMTNNYNIKNIIIGNGTFSEEISRTIREVSSIPIEIVDEAYTTVEAEKWYHREKGGFWQRCFFFLDWKPGKALDDYVAVILAERFLKKGQVDNDTR